MGSGTHCAVRGCHNTWKRLNEWLIVFYHDINTCRKDGEIKCILNIFILFCKLYKQPAQAHENCPPISEFRGAAAVTHTHTHEQRGMETRERGRGHKERQHERGDGILLLLLLLLQCLHWNCVLYLLVCWSNDPHHLVVVPY